MVCDYLMYVIDSLEMRLGVLEKHRAMSQVQKICLYCFIS